jgi:hypothetical protein
MPCSLVWLPGLMFKPNKKPTEAGVKLLASFSLRLRSWMWYVCVNRCTVSKQHDVTTNRPVFFIPINMLRISVLNINWVLE